MTRDQLHGILGAAGPPGPRSPVTPGHRGPVPARQHRTPAGPPGQRGPGGVGPPATDADAAVRHGSGAQSSETTTVDGFDAVVDRKQGPDIALLYVTATRVDDRPAFSLRLRWGDREFVADQEIHLRRQRPLPAQLTLPAIVKAQEGFDGSYWRDTFVALRQWWIGQQYLMRWLREMMETNERPHLVVWDNTPFEIPWELAYSTAPAHTGWIGTFLTVSRWMSVLDGRDPEEYSAERRSVDGRLMVLHDPDFDNEANGFAKFEVSRRFKVMEELLGYLDERDVERFGTLLIRCHGTMGAEPATTTLGGLAMHRLDDYTGRAIREFGPLVILNACVSARTVFPTDNDGVVAHSFTEHFLRYGAAGVVSVVGEVDKLQSHDFVITLLNLSAKDDVALARQLQRHRQAYTAPLPQSSGGQSKEDEQTYRRFFHAHLFQYYGHPYTVLRTRRRPAGDAP
ncbi:hypothetical protein AB0M43_36825 [Longispora sp. NPDC051575]|uniref:hypothetical protein n=1 Tax=Longispora sp. NPDC051575 TaxID=3154943 RepID=UPI0034365E84